jgi:hypothetical protein
MLIHTILDDSTTVDQPLGPGDFSVSVRSLPATLVSLTLPRQAAVPVSVPDTFEKVLGPLRGMIDKAMKKRTLLRVPIFSTQVPASRVG